MLTALNYYENKEFMSNSEFNLWRKCQARALAEHRGEYRQPPTEAMVLGNLVDYAITRPDMLGEFVAQTEEKHGLKIYKKDGGMYAWAAQYITMVDRLKSFPDAWNLLTLGDMQEPLTGEIGGVPWKCMPDSIHTAAGMIVDLKTTKTLGDEYSKARGKYVPWYEKYWQQMAVYTYIAGGSFGRDYAACLVGITKHDPGAVEIVAMPVNSTRFEFEIQSIIEALPAIMAMREGRVETEYCRDYDNCEFCRIHAPIRCVVAVG